MICTCHTKRRWGHKRPLGPGRAKNVRKRRKNIAPATQSERIGSRRTARRQGRNLPQNGTSVTGNFSQCHGDLLGGAKKILHLPHKQNVYTRNFSEPSRILHLPHKKQVGSPVSPNSGSQSTSRRH